MYWAHTLTPLALWNISPIVKADICLTGTGPVCTNQWVPDPVTDLNVMSFKENALARTVVSE
jgi:hypothetical protein